MKILHLSTYGSGGGAAIAALRIHKALREKGIDSHFAALKELTVASQNETVLNYGLTERVKNYLWHYIEKMPYFFYQRPVHSPFSFNLINRIGLNKIPFIEEADIVSLYWIGHGFLTPKQIKAIKKPLVWRLSDKWAFTGGCHLSGECKRYERKCGKCPQLQSSREKDITRYAWDRKYNYWKNLDLTVVAPSKWLQSCAQASSLFKEKKIVHIPTGIDENVFKPVDKKWARSVLNLKENSFIVLFGASNALHSNYKGASYFTEIASKFKGMEIEFLLFGSSLPEAGLESISNVKVLGNLKDEIALSVIYNSADVFLAPYKDDNLPNTVLEAMACGTPCVAFNSGGISDIIEHKINGYLTKENTCEELINGITWFMNDFKQHQLLSENARKKIVANFTKEMQVNQYIKLYKEILNG